MKEAKPFLISKREVWEAYQRVKANKGAAGIDEQSITEFEKDLKDNLYKLWNRMSSGSYFPPPVRTVMIPKASGGERKLGIPTVADRIAQTVVKAKLEPQVEPLFHSNSFGYRPGRSALDAVGQARRNCWKYDWVLDLDVRGFFDNLDWELLMKAVKKHAQEPWVVLYIERWLKTPAQEEGGTLVERTSGHAARRCHQSAVSESVSALCVRCVDGRGSFRICRLRGMPMMPSCIAGRDARLREFGML
jgi:RNA-directed DNA polymerase